MLYTSSVMTTETNNKKDATMQASQEIKGTKRVTLMSLTTGEPFGTYLVYWMTTALGWRVVGVDNQVVTIVYPTDVRGLVTANNIAAAAADAAE